MKSRIFESRSLLPRIFHIFAYTAHQGGLVLWYSPWSLTRRKIWDMAGYKRPHMLLKACAYRKKGIMLLLRGIKRYSVRPWRAWR